MAMAVFSPFYLKTAWRNFIRNKFFSVLNLVGLGIGMAACFLIFLFVQFEFSFDKFHSNSSRIYKVRAEWEMEGRTQISPTTSAPVAPALMEEFPEVQNAVRVEDQAVIVRYQDQIFREPHLLMVEPSFFEVFDFPLVSGNPETVLTEPNSIVISENMSRKYFGDQDPVGRSLFLMNKYPFTVTAVAENVPPNSHLKFDFLVRFDLINQFADFDYMSSWGAWNFTTYVLLPENFPVAQFEQKSPALIKKYRGPDADNPQRLLLQPLTSVHLDSTGKSKYILFFAAVAGVIMLLACINYMNLAIARGTRRIREIGIRKVIGAGRGQLARQFWGESLIYAVLSVPISLILLYLGLPAFNRIAESQIQLSIQNWLFPAGIFGIVILVSLISGSYPALFLSSFKPVDSLKGEFRAGSSQVRMRSLLVIFQFTASIVLVIGAVVIARQVHYVQHKDLGFDKEWVVNVPLYGEEERKNPEMIKNEMMKEPGIIKATASSFNPGSFPYQSVDWEGRTEAQDMMMSWYMADHDFVKTFDLDIIAGRDFSRDFPGDLKTAYLLNEAAVHKLGWKNPVGKQFRVLSSIFPQGKVVGIVKNFHFSSLHEEIRPLAIVLYPQGGYYISLKISSRSIPKTLSSIRRIFKEFSPQSPFSYWFLDERIAQLYLEEKRLGILLNAFTVLSLIIACSGLFGLASYSLNRRTKEIGVRKVLGASGSQIAVLLSRDFLKYVIIASALALPAAYYVMAKWLQSFVYRADLDWWLFAASVTGVTLIALGTIGFHTLQASRSNPADSLRHE